MIRSNEIYPDFSNYKYIVPFISDGIHSSLIETKLQFHPDLLQLVKVGGPARLEFPEPWFVVVREPSGIDASEVLHGELSCVQLRLVSEGREKRPVRELVTFPVHTCRPYLLTHQ